MPWRRAHFKITRLGLRHNDGDTRRNTVGCLNRREKKAHGNTLTTAGLQRYFNRGVAVLGEQFFNGGLTGKLVFCRQQQRREVLPTHVLVAIAQRGFGSGVPLDHV